MQVYQKDTGGLMSFLSLCLKGYSKLKCPAECLRSDEQANCLTLPHPEQVTHLTGRVTHVTGGVYIE